MRARRPEGVVVIGALAGVGRAIICADLWEASIGRATRGHAELEGYVLAEQIRD